VNAFDNFSRGKLSRDAHDPGVLASVEKKLLHCVAQLMVRNESAEPLFKFAEAIYSNRAVASPATRRPNECGN